MPTFSENLTYIYTTLLATPEMFFFNKMIVFNESVFIIIFVTTPNWDILCLCPVSRRVVTVYRFLITKLAIYNFIRNVAGDKKNKWRRWINFDIKKRKTPAAHSFIITGLILELVWALWSQIKSPNVIFKKLKNI